ITHNNVQGATMLKVENGIKEKLLTGSAASAALAGAAVAVTGAEALAPLACALGGIAIGIGAAAVGMAVSDSQTGYNGRWEEYLENLMTGGGAGYMAGASVYGLIAALPAVLTIAGTQAGMMPGNSNFTADVVPDITVAAGYGSAITSRVCAVILDKLFNNNVDAYQTAGMVLDMSAKAYTNFGESNPVLGNRKNSSDEEGMLFERLSDHYRDENEDRKEVKKYRGFEVGKHIRQHNRRDKIFDTKLVNNNEENPDTQGNGSGNLGSAGGGSVGFTTRSADGWYSDIAADTAAGSATSEIFVSSENGGDNIYVYDGLPWEPDNNTYFFDLRKAREDVWSLYESAGASKRMVSSMIMSSNVSTKYSEITYNGQYAALIDGIPALGVGVWPAMWKNYYSEYAMKTVIMDDVFANWTYKIAIVVVDKGEDVSDPSKWKYVPATRVSSKAHTFYGGVLQTYVTLKENGDIQSTGSNSGFSNNNIVGNVSSYGSDEASIIQMLKDIKAVNDRLGDAWVHYVEVYNIQKRNMDNINGNYDFAGYVIYGDTFKNMS
ncbi:MAG: hypothetical protein K2G55_21895, partial [Lachnospiraceae bacterium]|nr:hypothetical protein [Lachnospiraceae bacterium]